jgi:ankyrin repeat protein/N-acetylneuraminic acid mutarotase
MKTNILISGLLLGAVTFASAATNDLTSAIQRGLFEEEANQNLGAAIQAYQSVASQFDRDRKLAATAIFRLGECYRKQGNTNEAAIYYERILREFSDQPTLVTLSRQNLATLGSAPSAAAAPILSDAARQEQKRLLEEEIKLVQKQLDEQKKKMMVGAAGSDSLWPIEREIIELKRQVAALDAGLPISIAPTETTAPAASSEADEVKRIQALIKDSPDLINAPDRRGETLLESAAAKGKLAVVKLLLDSGAAVDGLQQPGLTALHYAAANGHKAVVDLLLSKGAKPGAQTDGGVTPLHLAARKGYEEVAKALIAAGAPVNAPAKGGGSSDSEDLQYQVGAGQTPLHLAAVGGYTGMAELLLAKGADPNVVDGNGDTGRTPLSYATQKHYEAVLKLLLAAHANPDAGGVDLPLATAAYDGDLTALKLLLANGADPNTNTMVNRSLSTRGNYFPQGATGTPLFLAVSQRHADAARELLRAKADPNATTPNHTPLLYEALADAPTLEVLLQGGADPNARISQGPPMLLQAVWDKKPAAVELLLAHKAEVNCTIENGTTPLQAATSLGDKVMAQLLLKAGADVNAKDKNGNTPLHEAAWRGLPELAELLLANKADPNAKDTVGQTPLHFAVRNGQRDLVELLLANKADPNERDNGGRTPLDYAKSMAQQPQPIRPGMIPGSPGQPFSVSTAPGQQGAKTETMADLLRRHGALDDLPHLDQIGVRRSSIAYSQALFTKSAQDWSQFTLLELIAVQYGLLAAGPDQGGGSSYGASRFLGDARLPFPDLAHLHISRPAADLKSWQDQAVDLTPVVDSGDCAKDVRLRWGDVVEIPEADHPLNEKWKGWSSAELGNLKKCLTRKVEIVVKGETTTVTLAPKITGLEGGQEGASPISPSSFPGRVTFEPLIYAQTPFWIRPVLLQSKLVLISSDLARVKVIRRDAATGKTREWVVDCSKGGESTPDLWLQDGDRIEVPEKTYASAPQAEAPQAAGQLAYQWRAAPPAGAPAAQTVQPAEKQPADTGAVRYSPKANDAALLNAGYQKDRSARTRQAETWEERAKSELSGRASTAVWTGTEMVVFGGEGMGTSFDDGARYCLAEDTWAMLPRKGAPSSRTGHAMVWTGKEVIVWGGFGGVNGDNANHNDGARYNPATDTWKPVSTKNAPAARFDFSAAWTGREMLVWGGYTDNHSRYQGAHADAYLRTGGRYDPATDTWKAIATQGAPSKRSFNSALWTGKELLVWGGGNANKVLNDGARYNPARDAWKPISTDGAPSPRYGHVAVWTGKEMIVWGGSARDPSDASDYFESGARYNPETDTWKPISTVGAPKGRVSATAVWTGTEMVFWGGVNDAQANGQGDASRYVGTGARYNPATDTWTEITTTGAPSPRLTSVVWTGEGLLTFGGYNNAHLNDTWFYSPQRTLYRYARE